MVDRGELDIYYVLWCDEAIFKLNGSINQRNCVYWESENLKDTIVNHVNLERVNVWRAISPKGIVGQLLF